MAPGRSSQSAASSSRPPRIRRAKSPIVQKMIVTARKSARELNNQRAIDGAKEGNTQRPQERLKTKYNFRLDLSVTCKRTMPRARVDLRVYPSYFTSCGHSKWHGPEDYPYMPIGWSGGPSVRCQRVQREVAEADTSVAAHRRP